MDHSRDIGIDTRSALRVRLSRWFRPPRILRPTRAGWLFFVITLGVGFAALNTGNNLTYLVLSLMLAFLVLSGVLSESSLRGIRVRRRLPRELYAGAQSSVALEITNTQQHLAAFAVVVEDRCAAASEPMACRGFALRVGPGETVRRHYRLEPKRRGPIEFEEFRVFTRFPFGLFSKSLTLPARESALVFPELEAIRTLAEFGSPKGAGECVPAPTGAGADAIGLREYAAGDPLRRIHWRASVRRRELLVRNVESEREAEVEVRLRTRGAKAGEPFERAIRWAASEVAALLDGGTRVALRTDDDHIDAGDGVRHRVRLLSYLALVEPSKTPDPAPIPEPA